MVQISLQNSAWKVVFYGWVPRKPPLPWAPMGVKVPWSLLVLMDSAQNMLNFALGCSSALINRYIICIL